MFCLVTGCVSGRRDRRYALLRQVHLLQSSISRDPALAIEDSIHFTDALGRTYHLQYQWFKHWDVFEPLLRCEFKALPGEKRVLSGHYYILNAKRKDMVIKQERWKQSVFPGSHVSMSMIIVGQIFKEDYYPRSCGGEYSLPNNGSRTINW
jgi:hypothetical protein